MHMYVHVCMYRYMGIYIYIHKTTCMYVYVFGFMDIFTSVYICIYVYLCIWIIHMSGENRGQPQMLSLVLFTRLYEVEFLFNLEFFD